MKALYNVWNSANDGILPDLVKAALPPDRGCKRVWWTNSYGNNRPAGVFTGQCANKECPSTSINPSLPDCKKTGNALHCLSGKSLERGGWWGMFTPGAQAKVWYMPLGYQSLNLSTHLRRYCHLDCVQNLRVPPQFFPHGLKVIHLEAQLFSVQTSRRTAQKH